MYSSQERLAIALSVILGTLLIAVVLIVLYFFNKYYRRTFVVNGRFHAVNTSEEDEDMEGTFYFNESHYGETDIQTQAQFLIPYGVALLRACKQFVHRLTAVAIDGTSKSQTTNMEPILQAAKEISPKVDDLTKAMYPPLDDRSILQAATALVSNLEQLIHVAQRHCHDDAMDWMPEEGSIIFQKLKLLCFNIDRYKRIQAQLRFDRAL